MRLPLCASQFRRSMSIADFLDAETSHLDELAGLRRRQLDLLPVRWRALLDHCMADLVHRHGSVPLGRNVARIEQGTSPQCDNFPSSDDEWGVLKAGAVKGDRFIPEENKRLPFEIVPETRYEIRAGDLLVTRANTPALVGAAAVVPDDVRSRLILCDKIFRLRLPPALLPEYVALLSQASAIRDARAASATGASSSMVNLTAGDVKSWPLPAPSLAEQRALVDTLMTTRESHYRLESALSIQLGVLTERRQALITAAVTGQLDVTTASTA